MLISRVWVKKEKGLCSVELESQCELWFTLIYFMRGHQSFSLFVSSRTTEEFPTYLSQVSTSCCIHSLKKNYVAVVFYVRRNLYYLHPMSYLVIRPSTHLFYQGNSSIFDIKKSYMIYKLTHFLLSLLSWDMSIHIKFEPKSYT